MLDSTLSPMEQASPSPAPSPSRRGGTGTLPDGRREERYPSAGEARTAGIPPEVDALPGEGFR